MKLVLDIHNHTVASGHAYSTVMDYVQAAKAAGLSLIAITDHAPAMPGSATRAYFTNLHVIPDEIEGVVVMKGAELNIMGPDGALDLPDGLLSQLSPNIASIHPPCFRFTTEEPTDAQRFEETTQTYLNVMDHPQIHIIGHPGDPRYPFDMEKVVRKSLLTGTLLEMNNSSLNPRSYRYGSEHILLELLALCKEMGCPIVVGSDAHFSSACGALEDTAALLKKANFPKELVANTSTDLFYALLKRKSELKEPK